MRWLISIPLLLLCGCADLGYYWHSARGHLAVMNQRVDIDELLADEATDTALRERLRLVQDIRAFSVARLDLPENDSYLSYVELGRPYLIQNLFAAPEFSTQLHQWCYPIIGCAGYRGYYDEERLRDEAGRLDSDGFEIYVGKVSAYSTLGWFDDPVLSSFIDLPDYRLAGLLFHELTHQQLYIEDDTTFNESLASAVQQVGTEMWLDSRGRQDELERHASWSLYRNEVIELIDSMRTRLNELYASETSDDNKRSEKNAIFDEARAAHGDLAVQHGISGGYTNWFASELNNAKIGSVAAYHSRKPAFLNMIRAHGNDFARFYAYAEAVGKLDKSRRDRCLDAWEQRQAGAKDCPEIETALVTAS